MNNARTHIEILRDLLETQLLGVLGSQKEGEPYTSLVGFAATPDLRQLLFVTGRSTRKLANLTAALDEFLKTPQVQDHLPEVVQLSGQSRAGCPENCEKVVECLLPCGLGSAGAMI